MTLLEALKTAPSSLFNQYAQADLGLDHPAAAERRLANLARYLARFSAAHYLLVGEAAGYGACRFSGVPFTDEQQLVGTAPLAWAGERYGYQRCSRLERPLLREPSARLVWSVLGDRADVALWNVVPWHTAGPRGSLSNRPPVRHEQRAGLELLALVLEGVFPEAAPVAVGRVAERCLREVGLTDVATLRHPAHGGATQFRVGFGAACPARGPMSPIGPMGRIVPGRG